MQPSEYVYYGLTLWYLTYRAVLCTENLSHHGCLAMADMCVGCEAPLSRALSLSISVLLSCFV